MLKCGAWHLRDFICRDRKELLHQMLLSLTYNVSISVVNSARSVFLYRIVQDCSLDKSLVLQEVFRELYGLYKGLRKNRY